jgi:hypothetical protein
MENTSLISIISVIIAFLSLLLAIPQIQRIIDRSQDQRILYRSKISYKKTDILHRIREGSTHYDNGFVLGVTDVSTHNYDAYILVSFPYEKENRTERDCVSVGDKYIYNNNGKRYILIIMQIYLMPDWIKKYIPFLFKGSILVLSKEL